MPFSIALRQQLLGQNEGFERSTSYSDSSLSVETHYRVIDGALHIREQGTTFGSDGNFDIERRANDEQTKRFLRRYLSELNSAVIVWIN